MKNIAYISLLIIFCASIAFKQANTGAIQGKISPTEGISEVLVITGIDTLRVPNQQGSFLAKGLPVATYTVVVKAIPPYQDFTLREVAVIDSVTTDVGQIKLLRD